MSINNKEKLIKIFIIIITVFFTCSYFTISINAAVNRDTIPKISSISSLPAEKIVVLCEQSVDKLPIEQIALLWSSNDSRRTVLSGTMDGKVTKRYIAWENKYKSQVAGTKDQRGLEDNTDLTVYVKNLNIKAKDYQDIRLFLEYISLGGTSCLTNAYCLEVYAVDENRKKYGPFHLESFEPNGFYVRTQGTAKRYDRGFNLVTEKLFVPENAVITELEIKPYGNYPARTRTLPQQTGSKNWRGREALTFALAGMKVVGYSQSGYQKPDYIKTKVINVDKVRENVVKRMYDMATVKWTPAIEFYDTFVRERPKGVKPRATFKPGSMYYGLPYTQRNRATVEKFSSEIKNNVLSEPKNIKEIWGADCVAAVDYALSKYIPLPVMNLTPDFIWDRNKFTLLGNLKIEGTENSSEALKKHYTEQEIYEAYAQLQKGDVLSTHYQKGAHTRMVSGSTHVSRNGDGLIDPQDSYIIISETSSALADTTDKNNYGGLINEEDYVVSFEPKKEYTDIKELKELAGKNTNFRINKKITFKQAYSRCYVPLTLNAYLTTSVEEPYARIINPNTVEDIKNGFKGTVYSNYTILSLTFNINNIGTGESKSFVVYPNHASGTLEGKYNGMYSLYYNTPVEVQNYLKNMLRDAEQFEVTVSVSAGDNENIEVLKIKRN